MAKQTYADKVKEKLKSLEIGSSFDKKQLTELLLKTK